MKDNGLVYTQITISLVNYLKKIRRELERAEMLKKRKRRRITKKEVCQELVKRCIQKGIA